MRELIEVN